MRQMRWMRAVGAAGLLLGTACAWAASGVLGDWKTPGGSVVRATECGATLCLTVIKLGPSAKGTTDDLNPDASLKGRRLCGMLIGEGFKADGEDAANGGHIYDPESGKTYSSKITRAGDKLKLRGFVGVSLFGRTEIWTRVDGVEPCR